MEDEILECPSCGSAVKNDDEFCPVCGVIFVEDVFCENHPQTEADGVCIICALPFCSECGGINKKHFLCSEHFDRQILEGMVRVYGTMDETDAEFIKSCLVQAGLNAIFYGADPQISGPKVISSMIFGSGDKGDNLANEIKILVPCQEVVEAEKIINELELSDEEIETDTEESETDENSIESVDEPLKSEKKADTGFDNPQIH